MIMIEIDFEVYKEITMKRISEDMTENDVIRQLLGLKNINKNSIDDNKINLEKNNEKPWVCKNVTFPHNTEFRGNYKGVLYIGKVDNGGLVLNGERFNSPSKAAIAITKTSVNGWIFWECRFPDSKKWLKINTLRDYF